MDRDYSHQVNVAPPKMIRFLSSILQAFGVLVAPFAFFLVGISYVHAAPSRLDTVVAFAKSNEATLRAEILSQPDIVQEMGIHGSSGDGASFQYALAFQEAYLKSGVPAAPAEAAQLIEDSKRVVIPFCHERICIFTVFDEDEESGNLQLVSFGASARAYRIAQGHARLQKLLPNYKGSARIIEYPQGKLEFLLVADELGHDVFLPATDEQAQRIGIANNDQPFLAPAKLALTIARLDADARAHAITEGPPQSPTSRPVATEEKNQLESSDGQNINQTRAKAAEQGQMTIHDTTDVAQVAEESEHSIWPVFGGGAILGILALWFYRRRN